MRRKIGVTAAIIGLIGVGAARGAWAQGQTPAPHTHSHTAPHGGEVVEVANHHVEFKADSSGVISVWLLDAHEQTVAPPTAATVTLIAGGGAQITLPLQAEAGSQRLVARFDPQKSPSFQAVVSVSIAGTKHNVRFRYPGHH